MALQIEKDRFIEEYWENKSKCVGECLRRMSERESWPVEEGHPILFKIDSRFSELSKLNFSEPKIIDGLVILLSLLDSQRALAVCRELEETEPRIMILLTTRSVELVENGGKYSTNAKAFKDRLITLYRADLLSKMFSKERLTEVLDVLKECNNEADA